MQEELLAQYIDSLKAKIERIDSLLSKFNEGNSKAGDNIRLLAHTLHGSGTSFGFPEISEAGKNAELADKEALAEKLLELKTVLEGVVANKSKTISSNGEKAEENSQQSDFLSDNKSQPVESPAEEKPSNKSGAENKGLKILIVDDDPQIASSVRKVLTSLPKSKKFVLVENGADAQQAIVMDTFDLIIMDLLLPDCDGRELIEQIKVEFQIKTPLLVISSLQSDSVRVECMGLGADKYLTKPFYEEVLLEEAKKLLGRKVKAKLTLVPMDGEVVKREEDEEQGSRPRYLEGNRILIAEDDKMQAALIQQRLCEEGASVVSASNGREAMQFIRSQEFSLMILDIKMPVMDGFEVLQRIRGELKLELPIIMVTAMGSEDDIIRGYDLGATDYILKPYSEVQLFARVKSLLKNKIVGRKSD